jgi:hypothetical protein
MYSYLRDEAGTITPLTLRLDLPGNLHSEVVSHQNVDIKLSLSRPREALTRTHLI